MRSGSLPAPPGHAASDVGLPLRRIGGLSRHQFWPDDLAFSDETLAGVIGYGQVTDSYLFHLAAARGARVATDDRGLAAAHPASSILAATS